MKIRVKISVLAILLSFPSIGQDSLKNYGFLTNLTINDSTLRIELKETIKDFEGNVYHTQKIGNQIWMIENLKTIHYNNGDPIEVIQDSIKWIKYDSGAYCTAFGVTHYSYKDKPGLYQRKVKLEEIFYNQYVVMDDRKVCPTGWHIPDISDWKELEKQVEVIQRVYLKNYANKWIEGTTKNGMGFSELPFGYRSGHDGEFNNYYDFGYWWSSVPHTAATAWARSLIYDDIHLDDGNYPKTEGMSIKCIKNNNR